MEQWAYTFFSRPRRHYRASPTLQRKQWDGPRTAQANQIRGLLGEFGLIVPQGIGYITQRVPGLLEDAGVELPVTMRSLIGRLLDHLCALHKQIAEIEREIKAWHQSNEHSRRLEKVPGIGLLTATALAATVGNARNFDNGRQVAAWLGLVPRQHSSGGKPNLLGMSKRGDAYLRTSLIHGARSVIYRATFGPMSKSLATCVAVTPRSVTSLTASSLNSRVNFPPSHPTPPRSSCA